MRHSSLAVSHQSPAPSERIAAFFDVDNTLVPGVAIEVRFFRYLWRRGIVGVPELVASARHLLCHVPPLSRHPLREHKPYLAGKRPSAIEPLAEEFVRTDIVPRLSSAATAALERHRADGHVLVLVTASVDFLVEPLARYLRVEQVLCAHPERQGDRYTGCLLPPFTYGTGKALAVRALACEKGVDLARSYAYGDSPGDVETLQAVGHPLVVNPIRGMGRVARRQGWPIVQWR
jgi:HAD superfamily hydrolase (TIGR01490 family)